MLLHVLNLSALFLALVVYGYCVWYWFRLWRDKKSGSAHALFLMSSVWMLAIVAEIAVYIDGLLADCPFFETHSVVVPLLFFMSSFFNVALAAGYFRNMEIKNDT